MLVETILASGNSNIQFTSSIRDRFSRNVFTGDFLPTPDIAGQETITNIASDEALSHIAFYGIGQVYLERTPGEDTYQVDVTSVSGCDTRPGFERPGAKAVFDSHGTLLEIFVYSLDMVVKPGQDNWEHAKWVWKNSLLLQVCSHY